MPPTSLLPTTRFFTCKFLLFHQGFVAFNGSRGGPTTAFLGGKYGTRSASTSMASLFAEVHTAGEGLTTYLGTGWYRVQAAQPLLQYACFSTIACLNLSRQKLAIPTRTWMANITANMIPTREHFSTSRITRKNTIINTHFSLNSHLPTENNFRLLLAETRGIKWDLTRTTLSYVAN